MVQMMWLPPGSLAVKISQPHWNTGMRQLGSPHHGATLLAEGGELEREDVWLLHNPLCLQPHPKAIHMSNDQKAAIHKCREYRAPVNATEVVERAKRWLHRRSNKGGRWGSGESQGKRLTEVLRFHVRF